MRNQVNGGLFHNINNFNNDNKIKIKRRNDLQNSVICIVLGVFSGVIAGMGMGGGTFLIPLLIMLCSFTQLQAQSINLLAFIPMAIVSLFVHIKNKLINYKGCGSVIIFAGCGTLVGVMLLNILNIDLIKKLYAVFLLGLGVFLFFDAIRLLKKEK